MMSTAHRTNACQLSTVVPQTRPYLTDRSTVHMDPRGQIMAQRDKMTEQSRAAGLDSRQCSYGLLNRHNMDDTSCLSPPGH